MSAVGTLQGRFAFVRFGNGPAPLVVLPGLAFDNAAPGAADARIYGWAMRRLAVGRTVTILNRPRGIAPPPPVVTSAPKTSPTCTPAS